MYRIGYEDPAFVGTHDPWHKVIECRSGTICPSGGDWLLCCTNSRLASAAKAILSKEVPRRMYDRLSPDDRIKWKGSLSRCIVKQDGDDGINAEFHVSDIGVFLNLMGAKRK